MYIDVCLIHVHKEGSLVRTLAKETSCYGQMCVFVQLWRSDVWSLNFQPLTLGSSQLPTSFSSIFLVTIVTKVRPNPLNDWLPQKERCWQSRWLSKKLKDFHLKALWAATPKWDARCSNSSVCSPGRTYLIRNDRKMWTRGIKRSISTQLNKTYRKVCVVFFDMTANLLILRKPSVHLLKMFPSPNLFQTCQTTVLHPGSSSLTRQLHFFPHQITRG